MFCFVVCVCVLFLITSIAVVFQEGRIGLREQGGDGDVDGHLGHAHLRVHGGIPEGRQLGRGGKIAREPSEWQVMC